MDRCCLLRCCIWLISAAVTAGLTGAPARAADPAGGPAKGHTILSTQSPWRVHVSWRKPVVPAEWLKAAGKSASGPAVLPVKVAWSSAADIQFLDTPPPPDSWRAADFDDGDWPRTPGPFRNDFSSTALICLRGRFLVTDPAAAGDLALSMAYRGGAVVYLNGTEVARFDLPAGPLGPATPAAAYPAEAFVAEDGKALATEGYAKGGDVERIAKRNRSAGPVALPARLLNKGVNVLAVELHRSDYHPVALTWWDADGYAYGKPLNWAPVALLRADLTATGNGIAPNIAPPTRPQVWPVDLHDRLDPVSYADPGPSVRPIRIAGALNGSHSGAFAVRGTAALEDLRCTASDLTRTGGPDKIPASTVEIRYAWPTDLSRSYRPSYVFDALAKNPPAKPAAVQLVWVTVRVPKDAKPGEYAGSVSVAAKGMPAASLPIQIDVAGWTVPDPREFRTHVGVYQSPTALALHYGVPEWSDEHWKRMETSFGLLAQLGTKLVNVPVVNQTQFGNDEGMVYWLKKADGTYDYGFTVFDRYIALVKKHLGVPDFVALQIWHSGGWETRKADQPNTVTVIDAGTKKRSALQVPVFGTDESKRFWKPALEALRAHLAKAGMDKSMCIGILSDGTAPPEVFKMFAEIMPDLGWTRGCHGSTNAAAPYGLPGGGKVVYHEFCYGLGIDDPAKRFPKIWSQHGPGAAYFRSDFDTTAPLAFHLTAERGLYIGTRGLGRCCLDFWPVPLKPGGPNVNIYNRWPNSSCAQRAPTVYCLSQPGPDGALPTIRYELLREGIQTAEAAIAVCEAADRRAAALGPALAAKCRELLVERINVARQVNGVGFSMFNGWRERDARLFAAAADVSRGGAGAR